MALENTEASWGISVAKGPPDLTVLPGGDCRARSTIGATPRYALNSRAMRSAARMPSTAALTMPPA